MDGPIDVRSSQAETTGRPALGPRCEESRALQLTVAGVCIPYGFVLSASILVLAHWNWMLIIPLVPTVSFFVAGVLALRRRVRWPSVGLGASLYMLGLVVLGSRGSPRTWYESTCTAAGVALFLFPLIMAAVSGYVLWSRWMPAAPRADHAG